MPLKRIPNPFKQRSKSWTMDHGHVNGGFLNDKDGTNNGSRSSSASSQSQDASNWDKFKLLLWKNYKIQIRHKLQTSFEILLPIMFTILMVVMRCIIESKVVQEPTTFPANEIFYSPNNSVVDELMDRIRTSFFNNSEFDTPITFTGFATENELVDKYLLSTSPTIGNINRSHETVKSDGPDLFGENAESSPILAGIVFTNDFPDDGSNFPTDIQYKLRFPAIPRASSDLIGDRFGIKKIWFSEILYPLVQLLGPRQPGDKTGGVPGYYEEGFLYLQYAIETTLVKLMSKNDSLLDSYDIKLQRFPYPPHINDKFIYILQGILPLTLILSFLFSTINITKLVLVEKETRLKIRATESQVLGVLPKSDPTLIYAALMTHIFQLVCFSFFVSTLFKTANSAAIVAAILWFIFFIPFTFLQPRYNKIDRLGKIGWSFGTNIGLCFCCQLICMFEGTGVGVHWNTIFEGATPDDPFCVFDCMMIMVVNGFFYFGLTIYVEAVFPGEYGIALPWYFPFTKWYWTGDLRSPDASTFQELDLISKRGLNKSEYFEVIATKSKPGIEIKGLTKQYGDKVAVKNLSLNMYKDEIFVLLGHNSAGKSTAMHILAGIFPPTSGTALIDGVDICTDMKAVRRSLGLCPQSNILFSELTVKEHLRFYSVLKGVHKSQVNSEVRRMIKAIGLEDKENVVSSALSGGMKRRLSVGIAFVGGSTCILLDEPSSGLDAGARRSIWDLIQREKKGRTVLLTTHYLDEADVLGDKLAIMAEGELQCYGTSLFLKKKYGCGYHLVIVKDPRCNVAKITEILRSKLDDVEEEQNVGAELSYALPDNMSHLFADVFEGLENRKVELGIDSYGCSITTMEEVFMRVGQLHDKQESDNNLSNGKQSDVRLNVDVTFLNGSKMSMNPQSQDKFNDMPHNTGRTLLVQQFWAMICKKIIFTWRKIGLLMAQIAICVVYPSLVLLIMTTVPGLYDPGPRLVVLEDYENFGKTVTTLHCPSHSPVCQGYNKYLQGRNNIVQEVPNNSTAEDYILKMATKDVSYVNFKYFAALEENSTAEKTELVGLFNNQPLHTPPLALNLITNGILTSFAEDNSSSQIQVTNHPFGYGPSFEELGSYFTVGFQVGLHFSLALGFLVAVYAIFPIKEQAMRSKHLQFISGVNFIVFWISNLLVDLVLYFLPCLALHLILIGFQVQDFYSVTVQFYLLLLFYCYAFAVLPMMYLSSLFFRVPSSGLVGMAVLNVLSGYATLFVGNIVSHPELDKDSLATTLHRIFLIVPTYSLGKGITQISINYQVGQACKIEFLDVLCESQPDRKSFLNWCCNKLKPDYLDWEELGIGRNLVYLTVFGIICWTILLVIDSGILSNTFGKFKRKVEHIGVKRSVPMIGKEDEDVKNERIRIDNSNLEFLSSTDNLIIRDLSKTYGNDTLAVDRISLGVKKGECFGLLGANGAGKTSTFQMLTGELPISSGDAYVYGHCIRTSLQKAHRNMGYCPQFDSLIEEMTGRETLWMYARLRGIPEACIHQTTVKLAEDLLFTKFLDRIVKTYSGGNKRKLSTAIALIGNPPILFLDEFTSGIDAVARRHLWDCISKIRDSGTSVVLTSHSMEETEFLCTRLAIMVNGRFRCCGSPQQLKSKFGEGYTLIAQTKIDDDTDEVIEDSTSTKRRRKPSGYNNSLEPWGSKLANLRSFIETSLPGSTLEDIHQGFVHYRVRNDQGVTWSQMFKVMEIAKEKFQVQYNIGQTSLEQVFLNFIRAQHNSEE
ncbi:ATP-binding cassette sub-family A member 3 [Folsomia candida]|uniref:ATP-binding cassette sub-family A member 3 n=1 Tax=Folsomia candida TaxID=158441 RepID=A0A226EPM4_FOLCA|nr:ATP-binding cassette sub-family A member 3 [Folsomia candida]